jgi:N-acetylmuramoyl-L-alanine amidase
MDPLTARRLAELHAYTATILPPVVRAPRPRWRAAVAAGVVVAFALAVAAGVALLPSGASPSQPPPPAAAPTPGVEIFGDTVLSPDGIAAAWAALGAPDPTTRVGLGVADLAALYQAEAALAGVRGDWAFAQAVHETGWFTSAGVLYRNFAGIGHCDACPSGVGFPDVPSGVRGHVQLLAKAASGNAAAFPVPDASPDWAGVPVARFDELGGPGRWATDPNYWGKLAGVYALLGGVVVA